MSLKNSSNFLHFFSVAAMNGGEKPSFRFKSFLLNSSERQLLRDGEPVTLTPKVFDTLVYLVERAGHLVQKSELIESVWRDSFVEEGNLACSIHVLRRALGQDGNGNKFIETVPTKGYRFVAEVTTEVEAAPPAHENGNVPTTNAWPDQPEIPRTDTTEPTQNHVSKRVVLMSLAALVAASLIFVAFTWNSGRPAPERRAGFAGRFAATASRCRKPGCDLRDRHCGFANCAAWAAGNDREAAERRAWLS